MTPDYSSVSEGPRRTETQTEVEEKQSIWRMRGSCPSLPCGNYQPIGRRCGWKITMQIKSTLHDLFCRYLESCMMSPAECILCSFVSPEA